MKKNLVDIREIIGMSKEANERLVEELFQGILNSDSLSDFYKNLIKDLNPMEKELFMKGWLSARIIDGAKELSGVIKSI